MTRSFGLAADGPFASVPAQNLDPNQRRILPITFSPTQAGPVTGALNGVGARCDGTAVSVAVAGQGVAEEARPPCPADGQTLSLVAVADHDADSNFRHAWTTPIVGRLRDTNDDGVVDGDDSVHIVVATFTDDQPGVSPDSLETLTSSVQGLLRAYTADLGIVWSNTSTFVSANVTPAIADLDGDGTVEVIAAIVTPLGLPVPDEDGVARRGLFLSGTLVAFSGQDGSVLWATQPWRLRSDTFADAGAIAVADIDGDGTVEIAFGDNVFEHDGRLRFRGDGSVVGDAGRGPSCFFAELTIAPGLELQCGPRTYSSTGELLRDHDAVDGVAGVGDVVVGDDADIVLRSAEGLSVWNVQSDVAIVSPFVLPRLAEHADSCVVGVAEDCEGAPGGVAVGPIDDIDGDDIALVNGQLLLVDGFWGPGLEERRRVVLGDSDGLGAPTLFDVDGDGRAEIVVTDSAGLVVVDEDGVRSSFPRENQSLLGAVSVADVNADGRAELVWATARPFGAVTSPASLLILTADQGWAAASAVSNQRHHTAALFSALLQPVPTALDAQKSRFVAGRCQAP